MTAELRSSTRAESRTSASSDGLLLDLQLVAASFEVLTSDSFTLFGNEYQAAPSGVPASNGRLTDIACGLLADVLYTALHCRAKGAASNSLILPRTRNVDAGAFLARLSSANSGTG